ncbi:hypothetical protein CPC08DRAFT_717408 [Agrocybe pediades]|nr:hypothetical protein CPC08DRAFT_717408 [Agrocybe pediades]
MMGVANQGAVDGSSSAAAVTLEGVVNDRGSQRWVEVVEDDGCGMSSEGRQQPAAMVREGWWWWW